MLTVQTGLEIQLLMISNQTYVFKQNNYKEDNMKIKYSNEFIINMGLGDPTARVYQFVFDENDSNEKHGLGLCIKLYFLWHICSIHGS